MISGRDLGVVRGGARLVCVTPSHQFPSGALMSLPRDLKVEIPGYGVAKNNEAYTVGGPQLTLKTVKQLTGLPINHVINVTFKGFWRAVNAIGCVYVDIDRRYYNDSAEYAYIDVQPGYQRMCGRKALQYVRFRHEDSDIVRAARQQDFLRQAKQQIAASDLIEKRDRLVTIFGRNTSTDTALRSRAEVLRLLKLALFSATQPIREVRFQGGIGPSYVESTPAQMRAMVQEFLQVRDSPGPRGESKRKVKRNKRKKLPAVGDIGLEDVVFHIERGDLLDILQSTIRSSSRLRDSLPPGRVLHPHGRKPDGSTMRPTLAIPGSREKQRPIVVPDQVVSARKLDTDIGYVRVSMFESC